MLPKSALPIPIWPQDLTDKGIHALCKSLPHLGDFPIRHYMQTDLRVLQASLEPYFLVDTRGQWDSDCGAALSIRELRDRLSSICERYGYRFYLAIRFVTETGTQLAVYTREDI